MFRVLVFALFLVSLSARAEVTHLAAPMATRSTVTAFDEVATAFKRVAKIPFENEEDKQSVKKVTERLSGSWNGLCYDRPGEEGFPYALLIEWDKDRGPVWANLFTGGYTFGDQKVKAQAMDLLPEQFGSSVEHVQGDPLHQKFARATYGWEKQEDQKPLSLYFLATPFPRRGKALDPDGSPGYSVRELVNPMDGKTEAVLLEKFCNQSTGCADNGKTYAKGEVMGYCRFDAKKHRAERGVR